MLKKMFYIGCAFLFFVPLVASAVTFSFSAPTSTAAVNGDLTVTLSADTLGADANAFSGSIIFPQDLLAVQSINDGDSLLNFWVAQPTAESGSISFSGITPGGFVGTGKILSVTFRAQRIGAGELSLSNAIALANDGNGTALATSGMPFLFSTLSAGPVGATETLVDHIAPSAFAPIIARDPNLFNDKWFVAFATDDKASSIVGYRVREARYPLFAFLSPWQKAVSPFVLSDQSRHSFVWIKAIDAAGNTRIEEVLPPSSMPFYANLEYWFILCVSLLVVALLFLAWKKSK